QDAETAEREGARREGLGLHWTELCVTGDPVVLVEREGERMISRDVTLTTRGGGKTPVALRGGVPVLAPERFLEPSDGNGNVYVLARWAEPGAYGETTRIVLEPDPERGYVLSDRNPDAVDLAPRGWAPYLPFFVGAALFVALSCVPWGGVVIAVVSVACLAGEILLIARWRTPILTTFALTISAESAYDALMNARERRREREAELDGSELDG